MEKKIQDLINGNPFGSNAKFNTIGRSNPFSSNKNNVNKNPFLDSGSNAKMGSSGEDVNDSPDSSLEPENEENGLTANINKIVSWSRLKCLSNYQIWTLNKRHPLKHSGRSYNSVAISMNFLDYAASEHCEPASILNSSW